MAVVVAGNRARTEHPRLQWREQEPRSPETVPPQRPPRPRPARAAVVYYLSRNGHLEHPHFMEVSPSSHDGLYLRDVIDRLDALRGKGMARMYSWSSKRSYRNGYVWHDLSDDDYIHPVCGREYVLKGTERLLPLPHPLLDAAVASSCSSGSQEIPTSALSGWEAGKAARRKKADAWGTPVLGEYMVYKSEERAAAAADAATQTDDHRSGRGRHRRVKEAAASAETQEELSREETSPPTASTSPETLEALIKPDAPVVAAVGGGGGRAKASSVLMQLFSCGSVSVKDAHTLPVMPRALYRARLPRSTVPGGETLSIDAVCETPAFLPKVVEDKEYFSGSLIERKRLPADMAGVSPVLRRSSSYNADRVLKVELAKEIVDMHDKCIPRKAKVKKEAGYVVISRNANGSKRFGG